MRSKHRIPALRRDQKKAAGNILTGRLGKYLSVASHGLLDKGPDTATAVGVVERFDETLNLYVRSLPFTLTEKELATYQSKMITIGRQILRGTKWRSNVDKDRYLLSYRPVAYNPYASKYDEGAESSGSNIQITWSALKSSLLEAVRMLASKTDQQFRSEAFANQVTIKREDNLELTATFLTEGNSYNYLRVYYYDRSSGRVGPYQATIGRYQLQMTQMNDRFALRWYSFDSQRYESESEIIRTILTVLKRQPG